MSDSETVLLPIVRSVTYSVLTLLKLLVTGLPCVSCNNALYLLFHSKLLKLKTVSIGISRLHNGGILHAEFIFSFEKSHL